MKILFFSFLMALAGQSYGAACNNKSLKGTYSFNAVGYAPIIPPEVLPVSITMGGAIPLHAIGHAVFDGKGNVKGYIQESVGGVTEMDVPFEGTYSISTQMDNRGCQGTWTLQDHHTLAPFVNEPPHVFRIALAQKNKSFHFLAVAGGPGPVTLSGIAVQAE